MNPSGVETRFFQSTRGRIILLLRHRSHTVDELAAALSVTDNAVRTHITALERDGLVARGEPRPTGGKPAFTYHLTADAERLFPKAYGLVLRELLRVLDERMRHHDLALALRETGRRLAGAVPPAEGTLEDRVNHAIAVLSNLGGLSTMRPEGAGFVIEGITCPLTLAVEGDADACLLAESLLADLVGAPVRERCDRGDTPRCRFEIGKPAGKEAAPDITER